MEGALRIGAWVALALGLHAAPALGLPLWTVSSEYERHYTITVQPRRAGDAPAATRPLDHDPAATPLTVFSGPVPAPPRPPRIVKCGIVKQRPAKHIEVKQQAKPPRHIDVKGTATPVRQGAVRCACCRSGCTAQSQGNACACMLPGAYDGFDPVAHPNIRPLPKPADPGCCACTGWALTSARPPTPARANPILR